MKKVGYYFYAKPHRDPLAIKKCLLNANSTQGNALVATTVKKAGLIKQY